MISQEDSDQVTWHTLMTYVLPRLNGIACQRFWDGLTLLNFSASHKPDLEQVCELVYRKTGWTLVRAEGEVPSEEFLNMLGRKEFPLVWELRPLQQVFAASEPDLWHELMGHVTMLLSPEVREVYLTFGQAAQKSAQDRSEKILELIRYYWFFGEYGLILEDGHPKIFGAGLMASPLGPERIKHRHVHIQKWTRERVLKTSYEPNAYQKNLFLFSSLDEVLKSAEL